MSLVGNIKVLGFILVFQVPYLFIGDSVSSKETSKKESIEKYLITEFFSAATVLILGLLFFHHKGAYSKSQLSLDLESSRLKGNRIKFRTQLRVVFRDPTYVCLLLACANNQAFFTSFSNNLTGVVTPWGFKEVSIDIT